MHTAYEPQRFSDKTQGQMSYRHKHIIERSLSYADKVTVNRSFKVIVKV